MGPQFRARDLEVSSGAWSAPQLILNHPYVVPGTTRRVPVEMRDMSELRVGAADPAAAGFDNRTLVGIGSGVIELRMPWALLGYSDPSSLRVVDARRGRHEPSAAANPKIGITIVAGDDSPVITSGYGWDPWNAVSWHLRRKAGWNTLRAAFTTAARIPPAVNE